jgi:hypothetical protein
MGSGHWGGEPLMDCAVRFPGQGAKVVFKERDAWPRGGLFRNGKTVPSMFRIRPETAFAPEGEDGPWNADETTSPNRGSEPLVRAARPEVFIPRPGTSARTTGSECIKPGSDFVGVPSGLSFSSQAEGVGKLAEHLMGQPLKCHTAFSLNLMLHPPLVRHPCSQPRR